MGAEPGRRGGGARAGASLLGRAWPLPPTLTWSADCAWLTLAPGVGCCSCFMAVIPGGPRRRSLPRGHFRLGNRHLAAIACHRRPTLSELAEGKQAATVGGGERKEGKTGGTRQALPCRIPPLATAEPLTPQSPRPPPLLSLQSLGDQTRPSGKLVERRAAGEGHLTALERRRAEPEEPGWHSTAVRGPHPPRGLSAPGSARQVEQRGAALQHLRSNRNVGEPCASRELLTRTAKAAGLRGPPHPPPPRGLLLKPGEAECAHEKPLVAPALSLGMLQRSEKAGAAGDWGSRAPPKPPTRVRTQEVVPDFDLKLCAS